MKRVFDLFVTTVGLIVISPIFFLISIFVLFKLGKPVFFTQVRPGKDGQPFRMIKFRTMTNQKDEDGNLLPNEERMTKFGGFLRSTSLDELPELLNVLKGDMSLVGPRPLLMAYIPHFTDEQMKRHNVKPGITGWSQVNGRNAIGWNKKLELDLWYVENQSFILDLKILGMTLVKVLKRDDINHQENVSMPRFDDFMIQKSKSDQHTE